MGAGKDREWQGLWRSLYRGVMSSVKIIMIKLTGFQVTACEKGFLRPCAGAVCFQAYIDNHNCAVRSR